MAIRKDVDYPGRWSAATTEYPMGKPKNRTTSTSKDGSYLEKKWIQDYEAFFGAVLNEAGVNPNGSVDTAESSQFFDALIATIGNTKGVTTLFENTAGEGNNVTIDWSSTGFSLSDFDLILLRGVTNNSANGGGGDVFTICEKGMLVGFGQIAIGESSRSGSADGYGYVGVKNASQTSVQTAIVELGASFEASFIGIYGIKL